MTEAKGHLIEKQVMRWIHEQLAAQERERGAGPVFAKPKDPIITVSRQSGSGGTALAGRISERLGFQLFDKEVIDVVSNETGVQRELLEALDERTRNGLEQWVAGVLHSRIMSGEDFARSLGKILVGVAHVGSAVVVGRGANFLLAGQPGFHVRFVAGLGWRIEEVRRRKGLSRTDAEDYVLRVDRERAEYIHQYLHHDIDDPTAYHIVLNLETVGPDVALETVVKLYDTVRRMP
jgi:cytidylate kinase